MTSPSNSDVQNLLPVQAYFNLDGSFNTFIGQGNPFYATVNPSQSGLNITNSTINSTTIGATTPSTGVFTNIATTTGTVATQPTGANDIVNLLALQSYAAGISWKQPCAVGTLTNITLSGLQTIDGYTTLAGDRVLVKDQTNAANNGIYLASATAWTRTLDADQWNDFISAISFLEYGTQAGGAWFCTAVPGGTLGVTALNWSQFTTSATYSAGTGLTLTGSVFSITPVGTASTYGSATQTPVFTTNASGQVSSVTNTTITPAVGSITGLGTGVATALAVNTGAAGAFVVNGGPLGTPSSGDFSTGTFTWPTFNQNTTGTAAKATNLVGGAAGSLPYQSALNTTTFLAAGTNGQVLTLASGVPSWATPTTGTVTSVGGTGTVSGITLSGTVTSSGNLTLGGTLDLSAPPAIGNTTANTIRGTTITATTGFVGTNYDAAGSGGGFLRTNTGNACLQWGGGGGTNVTIDGAINMNGANSAIQMNPTGTGTVSIAPAGALTVNPTTASTMNNVAIGGTTPLAGTFVNLRFNGTLSAAGSTGTAGFVMTSNGASAPTWQALPASGITITDDTTTNATRYLAFTSATSGTITGQNVSSTKLQFNPSTGVLSSTSFTGAGTGLTGTASSLSIGGNAANITASSNTSITSLSNLATVGTVTSGTWSGSFGAVSGANLTTLNASNLSSGTVATARLASGSASASTYLRGDQTWASISAFGSGQTWTNVTGSRATGTTYTNSTGKAIMVVVTPVASGSLIGTFNIAGSGVGVVQFTPSGGGGGSPFSYVIPDGVTYSVTNNSNFNINYWWELR
jgi:hypothetical protein